MLRQRSSFPVRLRTHLHSIVPGRALLWAIAALTTACSTVVAGGPAGGDGGSSSSGSSSGGEPSSAESCLALTPAKLSLFLEDKCLAPFKDSYLDPDPLPFEGAFEPVPGGFQVVGVSTTLEVLEAEPAIPKGTFVRMTFRCQEPYTFGTASAYVMLENLPELGGVPNPTEGGSRLWFFLTAGADYLSGPASFPFTTKTSASCTSEQDSGYVGIDERTVFDLDLSGADFQVSVPPLQSRLFHVSEGPHAGDYLAENIDIEHHHFSESAHLWNIENYRITRAP